MGKMTFYRDALGRKHLKETRVAWTAPVTFCQERPELARTKTEKGLVRQWKKRLWEAE